MTGLLSVDSVGKGEALGDRVGDGMTTTGGMEPCQSSSQLLLPLYECLFGSLPGFVQGDDFFFSDGWLKLIINQSKHGFSPYFVFAGYMCIIGATTGGLRQSMTLYRRDNPRENEI